MDSTINISIKDFVKKGKFDCIKIGQTKKWILENFMRPENELYDLTLDDEIWKYGAFEFYFKDDILASIFCGDLTLEAGKNFKVDKWILEDSFTLIKFIKLLNKKDIDFRLVNHFVKSEVPKLTRILILSSNVEFGFFSKHEKDTNKFPLGFFCLSR